MSITPETRAAAVAALDFPDGPGLFAYWDGEDKQLIRFDVFSRTDNIVVHGSNENNLGLVYRFESEFAKDYPGKWFRLRMPWDELQAQQDGVTAAMPAPDWDAAPDWAMWWTVDKDGKQHWWEKEPILDDRFAWWLYDWSKAPYRHCRIEYRPDDNGNDWRQTLQQRPPAR